MKPYYQRAGWRWLRGIAVTIQTGAGPREGVCTGHEQDGEHEIAWIPSDPDFLGAVLDMLPATALVPILDDPATQGAALAVLREVTGDAYLSVACAGHPVGRWYLIYGRATTAAVGDIAEATEAKALAAALDMLIPE